MSENESTQTGQQQAPSTFSQLVIMIATSALQQLGQVPDPSGKRGEVHLDGAQGMIDVLDVLKEKTQGNLDEGETKMLNESLTMLRMQYVEAAKATGQDPSKPSAPTDNAPPSPAAEEGAASSQADEPIQSSSSSDDTEEKTRYRKSYG